MSATLPTTAGSCCSTMHGLLDVSSAQALICARVVPMRHECVPLDLAEDRVLALAVDSAVDLPPFDNSAMDGYAVEWDDTLVAGRTLEVLAEQPAGAGVSRLTAGTVAIMTGARLPDGADTVIPIEQVQVLARDDADRPRRIRIEASPSRGQHVRCAGEDILRGVRAVEAGTRLDAGACMLLRGAGIATIDVVQRPRAALLCTGRELVDTAGSTLEPGQIHNTNGPYLMSRLRSAGADAVHVATISDDVALFVDEVRRSLDMGIDLLISTGAVSMGRFDFVPDALAILGADIVFHKVAMRPGKPLLFAMLPGGVPFFGLPGNPVSSVVGMRFYVEWALRTMLGMTPEQPWRLPLAEAVVKKSGFHLYQKAELSLADNGHVAVRVMKGQESFRTRPLLQAKVWAGLPAEAALLPAGHQVDVFPLCHFDQDFFARP